MRKNLEIIETRDYYRFKRLEGNRDVKCVKKIIDSINDVGYIMNPIIVNEKMEVIDGQNRLRALEELNMPVHYYIVRGANIDTARALNLGRTNWKPMDYVLSYAEEGNRSYQLLLKLMSDYNQVPLREMIAIIKNDVARGGCSPLISEGRFEMSEKEYKQAIETLEEITPIWDVINSIVGTKRLILTGLTFCLNAKGVDKKRLIYVVTTKYPMLKPVCDVELYLRDLTELYNKGLKDKSKKMDFDVLYRNKE